MTVLVVEGRGCEVRGEGAMKGWWRSSRAGTRRCSLVSKHLEEGVVCGRDVWVCGCDGTCSGSCVGVRGGATLTTSKSCYH